MQSSRRRQDSCAFEQNQKIGDFFLRAVDHLWAAKNKLGNKRHGRDFFRLFLGPSHSRILLRHVYLPPLPSAHRQRILAALYFPVTVSDFNHSVDQISFTDQPQRRLEELPLKNRFDVRNDDDQSSVQLSPTIEGQKIRAVVRNKRLISLHNQLRKFPVFRTAETEVSNMIGDVSRHMCQFEQGCVQAFVDKHLRHYAFFAGLYRATCNGFRFAQRRRAGRPRRGNAAT